MKRVLLQRAMEKLDSMFYQAVAPLTQGVDDLSKKRRKSLERGLWMKSPQRKRYEKFFRALPDGKFDELMSHFESMPAEIHKSFKEAAKNTPRDRGGRPPNFPLVARLQAIRDFGQELSRGYTLAEARDTVAKRYGMENDYVRKLWKNRKRLKAHLKGEQH